MDLKSANLVDILLKLNYISKDKVDVIVKANPQSDVVKELLFQKVLTKDLIGQAVAEFYKISYYDLTNKEIPKENLEVLSKELSDKYRLIYVSEDKTKVHFTTSIPEKMPFLQESLKKYFPKKKIELTYSLEEDILALFQTIEVPFADKFLKMVSTDEFNEISAYRATSLIRSCAGIRNNIKGRSMPISRMNLRFSRRESASISTPESTKAVTTTEFAQITFVTPAT